MSAVALCACGCGRAAPISKYNRPGLGHVKGQPIRFIRGHNSYGHTRGPDTRPRKPRRDTGELSANWKGGCVRHDGYVVIGRGQRQHIVIVERALGHALPEKALVHHVNQLRADNRNGNLVALQDNGEHFELHRKMRVRQAGGNPWTERLCGGCGHCKPNSAFYELTRKNGTKTFYSTCIDCSRASALERFRAKRSA